MTFGEEEEPLQPVKRRAVSTGEEPKENQSMERRKENEMPRLAQCLHLCVSVKVCPSMRPALLPGAVPSQRGTLPHVPGSCRNAGTSVAWLWWLHGSADSPRHGPWQKQSQEEWSSSQGMSFKGALTYQES